MIERTATEPCKHAGEYLIIPSYSVAIPRAGNLAETLSSFLASRGDFTTSGEIDTFPVIPHAQLRAHFPSYEILPVLAPVTRAFPERMETFLQRSVRRGQEAKIRAGIQRDKSRSDRRKAREARGLLDVTGIFD